jgi:hypothetical protein
MEAVTHQVGHLVREIDAAMIGMLGSVTSSREPEVEDDPLDNEDRRRAVDDVDRPRGLPQGRERPPRLRPEAHLGAIFQYDKQKPTGGVTIDGGLASTGERTVELTLEATDPGPNSSGVSRMRLKNSGGEWTRWSSYEPTKTWRLSRGAGTKKVYARCKDVVGNVSDPASDAIAYSP